MNIKIKAKNVGFKLNRVVSNHVRHGGLGSSWILQQKILWGEWVDGPCHHVHHHEDFSKVLPQGPTAAVHMLPTQDALVVLAQLSIIKGKQEEK